MKQKDLKRLAQQIANAEIIISTSSNSNEINKAKQSIMRLSRSLDIRDMDLVDELVQEILEKKIDK